MTSMGEFLLARLGEKWDREPHKSRWHLTLFAVRHAGWSVPGLRRRYATIYADHPDYDESWRP